MIVIKFIYSALLLIFLIPITVFLAILGIVFSFFSKDLAHYVEKLYFRIVLLLTFTKVEVDGLENIDFSKKYIIIANHQSYFDIISISAYIPLQIRWVSKESVFNIPFIGQFMKAMGYIALPRERLKSSVTVIRDKARVIDGCPAIFPEGTRSYDGSVQRFKRGFVILAEELGLDVLPVVVWGTINIMRRGEILVTPFRKVKLRVLSPIPNEVIVSDKRIQDKLAEMFVEELNKLRRG